MTLPGAGSASVLAPHPWLHNTYRHAEYFLKRNFDGSDPAMPSYATYPDDSARYSNGHAFVDRSMRVPSECVLLPHRLLRNNFGRARSWLRLPAARSNAYT